MSKLDRTRVWTGPDLVKTRDHLLVVDGELLARLARELPTEFHTPTTQDATQEFRSLVGSLLGGLAATLEELVTSGPGLAIILGAGLEELTDSQLTAFLYGLSLLLGRPMEQNHAGDRIMPVRDKHPADPNTARGFLSNQAMLMHTDATDVSSLLCLSPSASGGASVFVNAVAVHDVLTDEAPGALHEYYRLWTWALRGLQRPGASPTLSSPIFSCYAGELRCRYVSVMLREGASCVGGRLTHEQVAALDLFDEVSQRPELVLKHILRRGESIWMNNYRVLHGREAFHDGSSSDQTRLLLRTWIWWHEAPRLASSFASLDLALFGDDRLGNFQLTASP